MCMHGLHVCLWSACVCVAYMCVHGQRVCVVCLCMRGLHVCAWSACVCGLHVCAWPACVWNWPLYTVSDCLREWLWYCIHCGPWVSQFSKLKVIFLSYIGHSTGRFFDRRLNYSLLYTLPYYSSIIQPHWFFFNVRIRNINSFSVPHLVYHFKVLELFEFIFLLITAMWFQEMEMES